VPPEIGLRQSIRVRWNLAVNWCCQPGLFKEDTSSIFLYLPYDVVKGILCDAIYIL